MHLGYYIGTQLSRVPDRNSRVVTSPGGARVVTNNYGRQIDTLRIHPDFLFILNRIAKVAANNIYPLIIPQNLISYTLESQCFAKYVCV